MRANPFFCGDMSESRPDVAAETLVLLLPLRTPSTNLEKRGAKVGRQAAISMMSHSTILQLSRLTEVPVCLSGYFARVIRPCRLALTCRISEGVLLEEDAHPHCACYQTTGPAFSWPVPRTVSALLTSRQSRRILVKQPSV